MAGGTSNDAHINIVLSIIAPVALSVGKVLHRVNCLAPKVEMFVFARLGDEPMAVSVQTVLDPGLDILDCH